MITVIDDFLPAEEFEKLRTFVESIEFPWHYVQTASAAPGAFVPENSMETYGWVHLIFSESHNLKSWTITHFSSLFDKIIRDFNLKITRARASGKTYKKGFTENNYNLPHVDYFYPHISIIYYINESDGDTWLFDQMYTGHPEPTKFTVQNRITPKPNRLLLIDGLQYHTASNPINNDIRIILNINGVKL